MKYIFALVCLIALASSQLKNRDGTCDTTNWSDYTDADCTDATTDAMVVMMSAYVATQTVCKDVAGLWMYAKSNEKTCDGVCGTKGTCASSWATMEKAADTQMGTIASCTAQSGLCSSINDDSGSGDDSGDDSRDDKKECCVDVVLGMQMMGLILDTCSAEFQKMMDALPADAKTAAEAEWKKDYDAKAADWVASKCDTYSGKSFSSLASHVGFKDSVSDMPASSWFTSAFGLLLALQISYMK